MFKNIQYSQIYKPDIPGFSGVQKITAQMKNRFIALIVLFICEHTTCKQCKGLFLCFILRKIFAVIQSLVKSRINFINGIRKHFPYKINPGPFSLYPSSGNTLCPSACSGFCFREQTDTPEIFSFSP